MKRIFGFLRLKPYSKYVKQFQHPIPDFRDDAIIKINSDGKILYKKSVIEILIENKLGDMVNKLKKQFLIQFT